MGDVREIIADIIAAKVSGPDGWGGHTKKSHRLDQLDAADAIIAVLHPPADEAVIKRVADAVQQAAEDGADSPVDRGDAEQIARAALNAIQETVSHDPD